MANTNCLEGMACPQCGNEDRVTIVAIVTCEVTDDGIDETSDSEWDGDCDASCPSCQYRGQVKDWYVENQEPKPEEEDDGD